MPKRHFDNTSYTTGLNVALQTAFYPHYSFKRADRGPLHKPKGDVPKNMHKIPKRRGRFTDRIIYQMTKLLQEEDISLKDILSDTPTKNCDIRALRKYCTDYVREQLVPYLIENKLTPIESQAKVYNLECRVGTCIDLVCRTASRKFAIFEIKTGFDTYYERHTGRKMNTPFQDVNDSPRWQHQLYLHFAVQMFAKYREVEVDRTSCAVLRMCRDGLQCYPLFEWGTEVTDDAWKVLLEQKDWTYEDRRKYMGKCKRQCIRKSR